MQYLSDNSFDFNKFHARLKKGAIVKALKSWKKSQIPYKDIETDLLKSIIIAYKKQNVGIILSAYYEIGQFAQYSIPDLLNILFEKRDFPTFLKQAYRFGFYNGFEGKINYAILWHDEKHLPDAFSWKLKYEKLKESLVLEELNSDFVEESVYLENTIINVLDEQQSIERNKLIYFELKPIQRFRNTSIINSHAVEEHQPYIISQFSKKKLEQANLNHSKTLFILNCKLNQLGYQAIETKHIDAFSVLDSGPAIFEVKSITEENETDQVRCAISQLYEYRFLYSLNNASLWLVLSVEPFSGWIIDYLVNDRNINVLWIENNELVGLSKDKLKIRDIQ